ncbi:MAG: ankyrin repeat domain-containing protein [Bdellovibrionales bacterium]|nr:ankyrin repeat domain-containing protein [Bdellovibrionales bacterium]
MHRLILSALLLFSFYIYAKPVEFMQIQQAIEKGDLASLKKIKNFPVKITDKLKRTPLHIAVGAEKPEIVSWLISKKALVNARTVIGKTPLHVAALRKNKAITEILVKAGGDIHSLDNRQNSLLHYSFYSQQPGQKQKSFELSKFLVERKLKVNTQNKTSDTALHLAVGNGDLRNVMLLLENGAKVELLNMYKQTPAHQVLAESTPPKNYKKLISEMMKKKFPINLKDSSGKTILHYASEKGLLDVVKQVFGRKPNINMQTPEGWTPLHLASVNSHFPVIEFLVNQGADVNIKDKEGVTPLYFAVGSGNKHAVALLLKSKASVFLTDKAGKSLFDDKTRTKLEDLLAKFRKGK